VTRDLRAQAVEHVVSYALPALEYAVERRVPEHLAEDLRRYLADAYELGRVDGRGEGRAEAAAGVLRACELAARAWGVLGDAAKPEVPSPRPRGDESLAPAADTSLGAGTDASLRTSPDASPGAAPDTSPAARADASPKASGDTSGRSRLLTPTDVMRELGCRMDKAVQVMRSLRYVRVGKLLRLPPAELDRYVRGRGTADHWESRYAEEHDGEAAKGLLVPVRAATKPRAPKSARSAAEAGGGNERAASARTYLLTPVRRRQSRKER